MALGQPTATSRVRYRQGQLLASADPRDDLDYEARLRALHVRAVHKTWGVALGFEISLNQPAIPGGGLLNATGVRIGPGFAYDAGGAELLLGEGLFALAPTLPAGSTTDWWFDLLMRRQETPIPDGLIDAGDGCIASGIANPAERPVLRWLPTGPASGPGHLGTPVSRGAKLGAEIPLARVRVTATGFVTELDLGVRKRAQGLVRPHIANGRVHQGSTAVVGRTWDWSVWVDTSAAGFTRFPPTYFARPVDHPWQSPTSGFAGLINASTPAAREAKADGLLGVFSSITDASRTGFRFHVRTTIPDSAPISDWWPILMPVSGMPLPVAIDWVGVDPIGQDDSWLELLASGAFSMSFFG